MTTGPRNTDHLVVEPIGHVVCARDRPVDDDWGRVVSTSVLDDARFSPDAVAGLDAFSHLEVVYVFHLVDPGSIVTGARHPRGNPAWPPVGIFAQRGRNRPNRIGVSVCALLAVSGTELTVRGLDAIDGTPVLDVKPVMEEFGPRGEIRQPAWSHELMAEYWER